MLIFVLSLLGMPTFQKSKCKKLLETTMERIQHLKSRREVQLKQFWQDVILAVRRDKMQKAEAWLDRIWTETSKLSVYATIQEYCDTVRANLGNIAAQKECPIDLEEAVATICYAASCFADLPELQDVRHIFSMKYRSSLVASTPEFEKRDPHVNQEVVNAVSTNGPSEDLKKELLRLITERYKYKQSNNQAAATDDANPCAEMMAVMLSMQKNQFNKMEMVEYEPEDKPDMEELGAKFLANGKSFKRTSSGKLTKDSQFKRPHRRTSRSSARNARAEEDEEHNDDDVIHQNGRHRRNFENEERPVQFYLSKQARTPRNSAYIESINNKQIEVYSKVAPPPQRPPPPPPPTRPPPLPLGRVASMPSFQNVAQSPSPPRSTTLEDHERRAKNGCYVHPRLPEYDELVAQFAKKSQIKEC